MLIILISADACTSAQHSIDYSLQHAETEQFLLATILAAERGQETGSEDAAADTAITKQCTVLYSMPYRYDHLSTIWLVLSVAAIRPQRGLPGAITTLTITMAHHNIYTGCIPGLTRTQNVSVLAFRLTSTLNLLGTSCGGGSGGCNSSGHYTRRHLEEVDREGSRAGKSRKRIRLTARWHKSEGSRSNCSILRTSTTSGCTGTSCGLDHQSIDQSRIFSVNTARTNLGGSIGQVAMCKTRQQLDHDVTPLPEPAIASTSEWTIKSIKQSLSTIGIWHTAVFLTNILPDSGTLIGSSLSYSCNIDNLEQQEQSPQESIEILTSGGTLTTYIPCNSCSSSRILRDTFLSKEFEYVFSGAIVDIAVFIIINFLLLYLLIRFIYLIMHFIWTSLRGRNGQSRSAVLVTRKSCVGPCLFLKLEHSISYRRHAVSLLLLVLINCKSVFSQSFTGKAIAQSSPVAGATNTITVTIVTDTNLTATANSVVTISGLTTAVTTSPVTLLDAGDDGETIFSDGTTQGKGEWNSGILTLSVHGNNTLVAGKMYTFGFTITNPTTKTTSPTINIAASGSTLITSTAMAKPGTALYGVANGSDPLEVLVPSFGVKSIEQSTPVSGATNTLTVTVIANYNLADGSTVTISGLTGSQTADNAALTVTSTSGLLGSAGAWIQSSGELVLTVSSPGIVSGIACILTFDLNNMGSGDALPITIEAVILDASTIFIGSIVQSLMNKPGAFRYGVANGTDPFTISAPEFIIKAIGQSSTIPGESNTLTVTLSANFDLATGSTVTIFGLTGLQTGDTSNLSLTSTSNLLGTAGAWTRNSGQLVLTAASPGTTSGTACVVTFALTNTATARSSPSVSVAAAIEDGSGNSVGSIAQVAMAKPGAALFGVANGTDPLTIVLPTFSVITIRQSTPLPGASNIITMTMTANYNLYTGSVLTVTGLTGTQTTNSSSLSMTSTSNLLGTSAEWNIDGTLTLTSTAGGTQSGTSCELTLSLVNPSIDQSSPAVSISATIHSAETGGVIPGGSIAQVAMSKASGTVYGVTSSREPLMVVTPEWTIKSIQQSTPVATKNNIISVSLRSNYNLKSGSTITMTGLTGSQTASSSVLAIIPSPNDGRLPTTGNWNIAGSLILTIQGGGIFTGTTYSLSFNLENPAHHQISPPVSILSVVFASGSALTNIGIAPMMKPHGQYKGVFNGSDPLEVLVPEFIVRRIAQSTCLAGATNYLTITLKSNMYIHHDSAFPSITISPLTGAKATNPVSLQPVANGNSAPDLFRNTSGRWGCGSCAYETLNLDIVPGRLFSAQTEYIFDVVVRNPRINEWGVPQRHALLAPLAISATCGNIATFASKHMEVANLVRDGIVNGSQPLLVLQPEFSIKRITQTSTSQRATNTMHVMLQTQFAIPINSSITISGLQGAIASEGSMQLQDDLSGISNCSAHQQKCSLIFCAGIGSPILPGYGYWNNHTKSLTLYVCNTTVGREMIVFSFNVTNPPHGQATQPLTFQASLEYGEYDSNVETSIMESGLGSASPMLVNEFMIAQCAQNNATPAALNELTLTLATRAVLLPGTRVTLAGTNVCLYVSGRVYVLTSEGINTHTCTHTHTRTHTYTDVYSLSHTHTHTHIHMHACTHTHTQTHTHTHTHSRTHAHTHTHMHTHTQDSTAVQRPPAQTLSLPATAAQFLATRVRGQIPPVLLSLYCT